MPIFTVNTNVLASAIPSKFIFERVMVHVCPAQSLIFGGTQEPAVSATLVSIGKLCPDVNGKLSANLCKMIRENIGVPEDRIYIRFVDIKGSELGWNGTTK
ncbi:unnamed protein product [Soboliphyme baturini]|uniref:L-dopachrome isomerase n=1 Tax=Soboliphyme baturini TaxID=241478 RepID=A0A183INU9_9BILA|nr:unnamed protein product [Soboliphyme baturini]